MSIETIIYANGSKYAGQDPDDLETLFGVLATEPLNPLFEHYGDFCEDGGHAFDTLEHNERWRGYWLFHGNFLNVSHVFRVYTNDASVADRLLAAIRANKATDAYQEARRDLPPVIHK